MFSFYYCDDRREPEAIALCNCAEGGVDKRAARTTLRWSMLITDATDALCFSHRKQTLAPRATPRTVGAKFCFSDSLRRQKTTAEVGKAHKSPLQHFWRSRFLLGVGKGMKCQYFCKSRFLWPTCAWCTRPFHVLLSVAGQKFTIIVERGGLCWFSSTIVTLLLYVCSNLWTARYCTLTATADVCT
jgi:hypothetical protein